VQLTGDLDFKGVGETKPIHRRNRPQEHPPPHFHVAYQGQDASFSIADCLRLPGVNGLERYESAIYNWWADNKHKLIEIWNASRPTNCPVGPIPVPPPPSPKKRLSDIETDDLVVQIADLTKKLRE